MLKILLEYVTGFCKGKSKKYCENKSQSKQICDILNEIVAKARENIEEVREPIKGFEKYINNMI